MRIQYGLGTMLFFLIRFGSTGIRPRTGRERPYRSGGRRGVVAWIMAVLCPNDVWKHIFFGYTDFPIGIFLSIGV